MFDFNYKNTLCHASFLARLAFTYQIRGLKISPVGGGITYGIYWIGMYETDLIYTVWSNIERLIVAQLSRHAHFLWILQIRYHILKSPQMDFILCR